MNAANRWAARIAVLALCAACGGPRGGSAEPERADTAPAARTAGEAGEAAATASARSCASVEAEGPFTRAVDGAHRACEEDADCVGVHLDCSNVRCTAVARDAAAAYEAPLECEGYPGAVADYDCLPRFGAERAVCVAGCCTSERLHDRATADEACEALAQIYAAEGCTVFGPSVTVAQCLEDVRGIEAEGDPIRLRALAIGLDCARSVASCAQLRFCVAQFHAAD